MIYKCIKRIKSLCCGRNTIRNWQNSMQFLIWGYDLFIRKVKYYTATASGLLFFSWRRSKECNGQMERFDAISKDLKKRGMKFVGTIIIYAYVQAVVVNNSHESGCFLNPSQQ